jgi:putative DNA primase/helicase
MNTSRYAQGYIERGMAVVPIPDNRKSPVLPGWQNLRIKLEDVPHYFNSKPQSIGILLGEPSGGLVDVDLDVPEAIALAGHFLPPTLASGRASAPISHHWYRATGAKTEKWKDTDGEMLVELRSTGCQTLVEPSIHPSGERYAWHRDGETRIEELSPEVVLRACRELATATLLARHLPPVGGRHDYALAVAGVLAAAWAAGRRDCPRDHAGGVARRWRG